MGISSLSTASSLAMSLNNSKKLPNILMHASDSSLFNVLSLQSEIKTKLLCVKEPDKLYDFLPENMGAVLLLDLSLYGGDPAHPAVAAIFKIAFGQKIIVVTEKNDEAFLYSLFEKGARGFCSPTLAPGLLLKAVRVVGDGELWISRKLTAYCIGRLHLDSLAANATSGANAAQQLEKGALTGRELEIALCVAQGKCDKVVGCELKISPHTVKNHLRNIYKKMNVSDRFQLALICHGIDLAAEQDRRRLSNGRRLTDLRYSQVSR